MAYDLYLFDLDDTLLDFRASERLSFARTLEELGVTQDAAPLFAFYQHENEKLWKEFEQGKTTKEHLKVERFRRLFAQHRLELDAQRASDHYLAMLPETVVLIDHAVEICEWLSTRGEIGIITNGIHAVQTARLKNAPIAPFISFVSVSESCGFAKPDVRFFEHSSNMAKQFSKASSILIGDRLEADILGARNFGIDSCWYNPAGLPHPKELAPTYEIRHLSELRRILE